MGFWDDVKNKGTLSGNEGNRVKAIRLRGIFSQGILYPIKSKLEDDGLISHRISSDPYDGPGGYTRIIKTRYVELGDDVSEFLGITKYEVSVPAKLSASYENMVNIFGIPMGYDIENRKRFPNLLLEDEVVVLTEKLHGTNCQFGIAGGLNEDRLFGEGNVFVCSKGLGAKGFVFANDEANKSNTYVRALHQYDIISKLMFLANKYELNRLHIFGEVYGDVQDLKYGMSNGQIEFRAFDVYACSQNTSLRFNGWLDFDIYSALLNEVEIPTVPVITTGLWSEIHPDLDRYATGKTTLGGSHIREGVVIRPMIERRDYRHGRVILKEVSPDYLTRKGDVTEFN